MPIFLVLAIAMMIMLAILLLRGRKKDDGGYLSDISRRMDELGSKTEQELRAINEAMLKQQNEQARQVHEQLSSVNKSVHEQFSQSAKIISEVTEKLTKLEDTNKQVTNATDELKNLQNILLNPKHRGNFGEFQLNSLLDNIFPPNQWQEQYAFRDGSKVDAVVFIKDKILPVDSKFSLENYNKMVEEKDEIRRKAFEREVKNDLKRRVDETAKYIKPAEDTMDFAFMFLPSEALYYDLLINKIGEKGGSERDIIEYAFRDKSVIIVSPTTFAAYLQTVLHGLKGLQIEEEAKEIRKRVETLGARLRAYDDLMQKLGKNLDRAVGSYNDAYGKFRLVDKSVAQIAGGEETVLPLKIERANE
jgi:DNA recombination protein RmuC